MIRTLIYTDAPIVAHGLLAILSADPSIEVLDTPSNLADVRHPLQTAAPDILLLDLTPDVTFAELTDLKRSAPECKIVLWASSISHELAYQALSLGIRGVLRKSLASELIIKCLHKVHEGELWFEKTLTDSFLASNRVNLTRRESQLTILLSQGMKNKEIASALLITEGTVKVYLSKLFQKVGMKDRFELGLYALKNLTTSPAGGGTPLTFAESTSFRSLVVDRKQFVLPQAIPTQPSTR